MAKARTAKPQAAKPKKAHSASKPKSASKPRAARRAKSELEKRLEAQARAAGATLSADGDAFVLSRPGERTTLRVTEETDNLSIERYLRGVNA